MHLQTRYNKAYIKYVLLLVFQAFHLFMFKYIFRAIQNKCVFASHAT